MNLSEANIVIQACKDNDDESKLNEKSFLKAYHRSDHTADYIRDKSRQIMYVGGRRGMKTTGHAGKMAHTDLFYLPNEKGYIYYCSKTFDQARTLIWNKLKALKEHHNLDWNMNNYSSGLIRTPRNDIKILGFDDSDAVAKAMGMPFKLFIADECQEFRDDILRVTIRDGASWGSFDKSGTTVLSGNPARKKHTFYAKEWLYNQKVKKYQTNIFKNPMKTRAEIEEFLQEQRDLRGLIKGQEDAEFRRMALGEWVFDETDQVFQPKAHNYYKTLPTGSYQYIIGVDVGWSAYDAIVVLAYTYGNEKEIGKVYLVDEFQAKRQDFRQLSLKVHEYCKKYGANTIIIDTGALVDKAMPEITERYSNYAWIPAEKKQKMHWIEVLKVEMNLGNFKMPHKCIFDEEIPLIEYSEDRKGLNEKIHHSDILMAIAYPFRYIYNYIIKPKENYLREFSVDHQAGRYNQSWFDKNKQKSDWDNPEDSHW